MLKTVAYFKMKEKEGILGAEEQRCCDLQCISHEKVTDSICDPETKLRLASGVRTVNRTTKKKLAKMLQGPEHSSRRPTLMGN